MPWDNVAIFQDLFPAGIVSPVLRSDLYPLYVLHSADVTPDMPGPMRDCVWSVPCSMIISNWIMKLLAKSY